MHKQRCSLRGSLRQKTNMAARKKDGSPDWKYYESAETIALFEPVKQYLLKNCKKVIATWLKICIRKFDCFSCGSVYTEYEHMAGVL